MDPFEEETERESANPAGTTPDGAESGETADESTDTGVKSGETPTDSAPPRGRPDRPRRVKGSRRVTYSAAAAAIGTVCSLIAIYLPVKVMPLVVAAFCFFIVFDKCGIGYGLITEAVTLLMTFFVSGIAINVTFVMLAVVFVPYAPIAYALRKLGYNRVGTAAVRGITIATFVNLAFLAVYQIVIHVALEGLDIAGLVQKAGGYWVIALILIPLSVSIDFLFTQMAVYIRKMLK